jgi:hypothetical protein
LKYQIDNSSLDISYEEAKVIAVASVGTLALSGVLLNAGEISEAIEGMSNWFGERLTEFLIP